MKLRHVLDCGQFEDTKLLESILREASRLEGLHKRRELPQSMKGKVMATLFYEPSTRTRLSFESAMARLGGSVIGTEDAKQFSSLVKGETLADSARIVSGYADVIVMRHPEPGSARRAAENSLVPVINAGDGPAQHPTQAILDMYTIWKEMGRLDNLSITMVGDLLYGRTIHSLAHLLAQRKGVKMHFVAPEQLRIPDTLRGYLREKGVDYRETSSLEEAAGKADVLYMTRIQKERFPTEKEYLKLRGCYILDRKILGLMKKSSVIMHPLPRVDELSTEVDSDPRAAYFRQAGNGLYVRMALLNTILGGEG